MGFLSKLRKPVFPQRGAQQELFLYAPMRGEIVPNCTFHDAVFREEVLGKTFAIEPSEGILYSPADGIITAVYSTLHAVCISTDHGTELLLHIGEDTVKLNGTYFYGNLQEGQHVTAGEQLIQFDMDAIKKAGYTVTTCFIIINGNNYAKINLEETSFVQKHQLLLTLWENVHIS